MDKSVDQDGRALGEEGFVAAAVQATRQRQGSVLDA